MSMAVQQRPQGRGFAFAYVTNGRGTGPTTGGTLVAIVNEETIAVGMKSLVHPGGTKGAKGARQGE